jgi:hypothetical protein
MRSAAVLPGCTSLLQVAAQLSSRKPSFGSVFSANHLIEKEFIESPGVGTKLD